MTDCKGYVMLVEVANAITYLLDDRQTADGQREQLSSSILIRCCDAGLIRRVY